MHEKQKRVQKNRAGFSRTSDAHLGYATNACLLHWRGSTQWHGASFLFLPGRSGSSGDMGAQGNTKESRIGDLVLENVCGKLRIINSFSTGTHFISILLIICRFYTASETRKGIKII